MNYIVIELQTNAAGQTANIVTAYDNLPQAESKFYTVCAAAALSNVLMHSVVIIDQTGMVISNRSFSHPMINE